MKKGNELKPLDLLSSLKKIENSGTYTDLENVYLVYGDEFFIWDRTIQRIKNILNTKAGIERVNFENININDWINDLNNISMFNPTRLIIASELDDLKESALKTFLTYLENPSKDIILLIFSQKLDKRKKSIKLVIDKVCSCNAKHPRDAELSKWINGFASERGKKIDYDATEFLKLRFSNDLSSIEKEIEKLALYFQNKTSLTRKDVEFLSSGLTGASIFDLFPVFASKNKAQTLNILSKLLKAGENQIMINSMLMGRIKKFLNASCLIKNGLNDNELSSEIGIHKFYLRNFKDELKNFSKDELEKMYLKCLNIDSSLKSSNYNKNDILINGVLNLFIKE